MVDGVAGAGAAAGVVAVGAAEVFPAGVAAPEAAARAAVGNPMSTNSLTIDHEQLVAASHAAERLTSGEIRVALARHKIGDPMAAARKHFVRLKMARTAERNGVLILVAPRSRNFAIFGDTGVHEKCGDAFWQEVASAMTEFFRRGDFTGGIIHGVERAGALLAGHFPRRSDDRNELPDDIEEV